MELKSIDALRHTHAVSRTCGRIIGIAQQQLIAGSAESYKARGIGAVTEIEANGTHRGFITDAKPDGLHHVVEVLIGTLTETETDLVNVGIDVAHVVKEHAAYIVPDERETQLGLMEQEGVASHGKSGFVIARPGLVIREGALEEAPPPKKRSPNGIMGTPPRR